MTASEPSHPSIADIPEDRLVEKLLSDPIWRFEMFDFHGMPPTLEHRTRVLLDHAPGGLRGDVDILRSSCSRPQESIAYEVKRLKFGKAALRPGGLPNKLCEYKKAVQQANRLATVGFWMVYLYIITVVDSREQNAGKNTFDGLSSELKHVVHSVVTSTALDKRVGLCELEFTQPMNHAPFEVGSHGLHLHRLATAAPQSEQLTKWVAELFSSSDETVV